MVPIIFCIPVFGSSLGYVCGVPTHILLRILSMVLIVLLLPITLMNTIDSCEMNLGFWSMHLFVLGTLMFIVLATLGIRRYSEGLISASFAVWLVTYAGFLILAVYSVWTPKTIERTSINGRCMMNLWLFSWCCKATGIQCEPSPSFDGRSFGVIILDNLQASLNIDLDVKHFQNENDWNTPDLADKFSLAGNKTETKGTIALAESDRRNQNTTNQTLPNGTVMPNNIRMMSGYIFKNNICYREMSEKKNETQTDLRGQKQRKSAAAFLGTLAIMLAVISLYTLYAVALNDTLTVLRYPFPVVFVARMPPSPEEGTSEQKTPKIEAK